MHKQSLRILLASALAIGFITFMIHFWNTSVLSTEKARLREAARAKVAKFFSTLEQDLAEAGEPFIASGWVMQDRLGRSHSRSALERHSTNLVAIGPDAVPFIVDHVSSEDMVTRYLARCAAERITGILSDANVFAEYSENGYESDVQKWRRWEQR